MRVVERREQFEGVGFQFNPNLLGQQIFLPQCPSDAMGSSTQIGDNGILAPNIFMYRVFFAHALGFSARSDRAV